VSQKTLICISVSTTARTCNRSYAISVLVFSVLCFFQWVILCFSWIPSAFM
jgi:hypothetical protein